MSRGGVVVDRVVDCPGMGSGQAAELMVSLVSGRGDYHAVRVASDRVQFARTFRPTWATVLGWCSLLIFLIGVVFFFVKTTETCIATIESDHRGTRIRLSGRLDAAVLQQLLAAFDDPAAAARDAALASAVGAPVDPAAPMPSVNLSPVPAPAAPAPPIPVVGPPASVPSAVPAPPHSGPPPLLDPNPAPAPAQVPLPAPAAAPLLPQTPIPSTGWVPVWEREDVVAVGVPASSMGPQFDPSSTIIVPKRSAGSLQLRAVLDNGTELDLSSVVLVGRDPAPGTGEEGSLLVPVVDPERSVSKTHLRLEMLGGVVLVTDRGSTNGTSLVTADGTVTGIAPGVPTEVPAGCSVRFGARTVRLLSTGPAGGSL